MSICCPRPYKVGDWLPSERDFAADFVTKRVGPSTCLNRKISRNWNSHAVNLVIDNRCNGAIQKLSEQCGR